MRRWKSLIVFFSRLLATTFVTLYYIYCEFGECSIFDETIERYGFKILCYDTHLSYLTEKLIVLQIEILWNILIRFYRSFWATFVFIIEVNLLFVPFVLHLLCVDVTLNNFHFIKCEIYSHLLNGTKRHNKIITLYMNSCHIV